MNIDQYYSNKVLNNTMIPSLLCFMISWTISGWDQQEYDPVAKMEADDLR